MVEDNTASDPCPDETPPLGSWTRVYLLVCGVAIAVLLVLYWFTATFNLPMEAR